MARPIVLVYLSPENKTRPALVLTREAVQPVLNALTVAPIYSKIRGIRTEVGVDQRNGLDHESVINLDNIATVSKDRIGRQVGYLYDDQEDALTEAIVAAFALEV